MKKQLNQKYFLYIIIGLLLVCCIVLGFIAFKGKGTINNKHTSFEDKEKCMKYYDSFKKTLEDRYNSSENSKFEYHYQNSLNEYEMFYSPLLDSCVCAYSQYGYIYDSDNNMKPYPYYSYDIVDFLNGEKELYRCHFNTYMVHLDGGTNYTDPQACSDNRRNEKEKYKIQN